LTFFYVKQLFDGVLFRPQVSNYKLKKKYLKKKKNQIFEKAKI